jgi:hypothetical protein
VLSERLPAGLSMSVSLLTGRSMRV